MNTQNNRQVLKKQVRRDLHFGRSTVDQNFLLKYAPKFCKQLYLPESCVKSGSIYPKVKKIKKIDYIVAPHDHQKQVVEASKGKGRSIKKLSLEFDDKFKKYFTNMPNYTLSMTSYGNELPKSFLFSKCIQNLELNISRPITEQAALQLLAWRLWKHLESLTMLKCFKISFPYGINQSVHDFLTKLEARYSHLLSSLKDFEISFNTAEALKIIPEILILPKTYKYLTSYRILNTISSFHKSFFLSISFFTNLIHLGLDLKHEDISLQDTEYFQVLNTLNKIQTLDLSIRLKQEQHLKTFLECMTLPASLINLNLEIDYVNWNYLIPNLETHDFWFINPFAKEKHCCTFYDRFSQLKVLETLQINFHFVQKCPISSAYFILPILERLSSLKHLSYTNKHDSNDKIKSLDFAQLCFKINHLSSNLKTLNIDDFAISLEKLKPKLFCSMSLTSLNLNAHLIGDSKIGILAEMFGESSKNPNVTYNLTIGKIIIKNDQSFVDFLGSLTKYARKPNIITKIDIDARNTRMGNLSQSLINFVMQGKKLTNVSLEIWEVWRVVIDREKLLELLDQYQTFNSLILRTGGTQKSKRRCFLFDRHRSLLRIRQLNQQKSIENLISIEDSWFPGNFKDDRSYYDDSDSYATDGEYYFDLEGSPDWCYGFEKIDFDS